MHPSQKYLDPRELAKLQGLQLRARAIVDGFIAGRHRSTGRGLSLEFSEHREYSPGDDWRHIDWKVFARTDKYHLKQFEDESNLSCYFLLDSSESMSYRGPAAAMSKLEYAKCLVASLAWLVHSHQDAVGAAIFSDALQEFMPASASPAATSELAERMDAIVGLGKTDLAQSVADFSDRVKRRSVVVVVSDFFSNVNQISQGLKRLVYDRHDVAAIQLLDSAELDFPFRSNMTFESMESAASVAIDASLIAQSYRQRIEEYCQDLRSSCGDLAVRYQLVRTDEPLDLALSQFLAPVSSSI